MLALLLRTVGRVPVGSVVGLFAGAIRRRNMRSRGRRTVPNANVNDRVVAEVLISADDGVALLILKAHPGAACGSRVEAVEVLDGGNNGLGGVMRVDLDPHRYARPVLVRVLNQLELDRPGDRGCLVRVSGLCELHDGSVSTHRGQNMGFGGGRRGVVLGWVACSDRTGLCSWGDVRDGRLCRHQTVLCHS